MGRALWNLAHVSFSQPSVFCSRYPGPGGDRSRLVAGGFLVTRLQEVTALGLTFFSCQGPQTHFSGFVAPFPTRGQNQPRLALAAAACGGGNPDLSWKLGFSARARGFLALSRDPGPRLRFGEMISSAAFPFTRLGGSCWQGTNDAACKIQPRNGSCKKSCTFFTSRWQFCPAPANLSGGRAVHIVDFFWFP